MGYTWEASRHPEPWPALCLAEQPQGPGPGDGAGQAGGVAHGVGSEGPGDVPQRNHGGMAWGWGKPWGNQQQNFLVID